MDNYSNDNWELIAETISTIEVLMSNGVCVALWKTLKPIFASIIEHILSIFLYLATSLRNENVFKKRKPDRKGTLLITVNYDNIKWTPYMKYSYSLKQIITQIYSIYLLDQLKSFEWRLLVSQIKVLNCLPERNYMMEMTRNNLYLF